jgi:Mg-chelatase subunit ChlD
MHTGWPELSLADPAWLAAFLVLPLVYLGTRHGLTNFALGRQVLCLALRSLVVIALVLALCGPEAGGLPRPAFVVFLVDSSASIAPASRRSAGDFVDRATQASQDRQAARLYFATTPVVAREGQAEPDMDRQATDLAAALEAAYAIAPPDTAPHVVLLSDGVPTRGDTPRAIEAARNAGVRVSTVPLAFCEPEVYVSDLRTPSVVREGEPFELEVAIHSTHDDEGTVEIACQPATSAQQRVRVKKGENRFRFRQSIAGEPTQTLTARISGFRDTLAENNAVETLLAVRPRPRVMLVENRAFSGGQLAKALRGGGLAVEICRARDAPDALDKLNRFEAVVLVNVPAALISQRQMEALKDYVRQGGGLVTIGGDQAFTPGGYRKTPLEDILPVESEPSRKKARPSLAMVLVVDRSLSMEEGGAIELAREAMRGAVRLLEAEDQLGVLAFDEQTRWVSPIERVGDKAQVLSRIASITAGGRTDMAPALQKAYLALREAFAAQKHMIVLTDGISHPADFEALAERIAREGITISTMALGKEASRPLLEDMARLGKGRFYACDSAQAVPSVFALETASARRLGIREEPFFARKAGQPEMLNGLELGGSPSLLGYAETRPKPGAQVVLTSAAGDPLLAWFRCGEGTSVAFTSDVEGRWAAAWMGWKDFGRFWTQVVRAALRPEKRGQEPFSPLDLAKGKDDPAKMVPDPFSRAFSRSYPDEFRVRPTDHDLLRGIAAATGGVYQIEPEDVWDLPSPGNLPAVPIHQCFLAAAAVLFVLDAAARRLL